MTPSRDDGSCLRVLVVDDEPLARRRLERMLADMDGSELVGAAEDGSSALEAIARLRPDVVLLDIQMPGSDGIAVARRAVDRAAIIFVTAHAAHAIEAFDAEAVDYLLKPVDAVRLARALDRARTRTGGEERAALFGRVLDRLANERVPRVTARRGAATYYFDAREIVRFRAGDKYVTFEHSGGRYLTDEPLADLATRLGEHGFVRVHRSELIRLNAIRALHAGHRGPRLELIDGQELRVSRRRLAMLKQVLEAP